jgi:hypothetical protein
MNKEKQIEEMAKVIFEVSPIPSVWRSDATRFAESLYNAGYRKATEVAREIFAEIEGFLSEKKFGTFYFNYLNDLIAELKKKYTEDGE